jgi:hypothetical protein
VVDHRSEDAELAEATLALLKVKVSAVSALALAWDEARE